MTPTLFLSRIELTSFVVLQMPTGSTRQSLLSSRDTTSRLTVHKILKPRTALTHCDALSQTFGTASCRRIAWAWRPAPSVSCVPISRRTARTRVPTSGKSELSHVKSVHSQWRLSRLLDTLRSWGPIGEKAVVTTDAGEIGTTLRCSAFPLRC